MDKKGKLTKEGWIKNKIIEVLAENPNKLNKRQLAIRIGKLRENPYGKIPYATLHKCVDGLLAKQLVAENPILSEKGREVGISLELTFWGLHCAIYKKPSYDVTISLAKRILDSLNQDKMKTTPLSHFAYLLCKEGLESENKQLVIKYAEAMAQKVMKRFEENIKLGADKVDIQKDEFMLSTMEASQITHLALLQIPSANGHALRLGAKVLDELDEWESFIVKRAFKSVFEQALYSRRELFLKVPKKIWIEKVQRAGPTEIVIPLVCPCGHITWFQEDIHLFLTKTHKCKRCGRERSLTELKKSTRQKLFTRGFKKRR